MYKTPDRMKLHNLIYMTLAVCFILASCSKTDADSSSLGRSLIGFNTVSTKAASAYPTGNPFITTSYKLASGKTWDANKADAGSPIINQEEVTYNSTYNYWKTATDYYWPTDGSTLTFFSYSPASLKGTVRVTTDGVGISSWDVKTNTGDILVADIAQDKTKNESLAGYTGVPTLFKHKLSRIVFQFGIADEASKETQIKVTSIVLKGVYSSGEYSRGGYSDDQWRPSSLPSEWKLYENKTGLKLSKESLSSELPFNMIPQSLLATGTTHPELVIGYDISTDSGKNWRSETASCFFDENLRLESWEKGKKYTYKIYIGVGLYPIKFKGEVTDWSNGDTSTITIG